MGEYNLRQHMYGLHPELVNVPLSIYGNRASGEVSETVSIIDILRQSRPSPGWTWNTRVRTYSTTPPRRLCITESLGIRDISRDTLTEN